MDWRIQLLAREEVAEQTLAFTFARPSGLSFTAGQFVDVNLVDTVEGDAEGPGRTLTIASAPCEDRLLFALRMRDTPFKRALRQLPLGGEVVMDEPIGAFTLPSEISRPAILLAGGIGVTPFRLGPVQVIGQ